MKTATNFNKTVRVGGSYRYCILSIDTIRLRHRRSRWDYCDTEIKHVNHNFKLIYENYY